MKNDITYEYRVFTNRLVDVESMEVGKCTSKVLKDLKSKDKVDGRFFHTSDTDEWFFCWNGKLQKLNLKGNADVNSALEEVNKLIADANAAIEDANKTAAIAGSAASDAIIAAESANKAVETIDNKIAEKANASDVTALSSDVNILKTSVEDKANKSDLEDLTSDVDLLSETVNKIDLSTKVDKSELDNYSKIGHTHDYATEKFVGDAIAGINIPTVPTKVSELENDVKYLTQQDIAGKQDVIEDLDDIRDNVALAKTAIQVIPEEYVTEEELAAKGYLTSVNMEGKQDVIEDLDAIRDGAAAGSVAEQNAKLYADGLATNYDSAGAAAQALTDAKLYADSLVKDAEGNSIYQAKGEYALQSYVLGEITRIDGIIGEATNITNNILS